MTPFRKPELPAVKPAVHAGLSGASGPVTLELRRIESGHVPRSPKGVGGFSLIFMSIFITAMAMLFVSVLPGKEDGDTNAKTISDIDKLNTIEEHMRSFMAFNGRRPCPADGQYPENSKYFGQEAGTPGTCQGNASPTPNAPLGPDASGNIIAGVIPTRNLGLDTSYAFDSYGRRFTYVVDKRATSSLTCDTLQSEIKSHALPGGGITIKDAAENSIDQVMYAYIQHGQSGYGAWPGDGSATTLTAANSVARRVNSGSTDKFMQTDAWVDVAGSPPGASGFTPTPSATLYKNSMTVPMTTGGKLDTGFDDLVWYRDDLKNTCCFKPSSSTFDGPDIMVGMYTNTAPSVMGYKLGCGQWHQTSPDPNPTVSTIINNLFVTTNNQYMVFKEYNSGCYEYQRSGMAWTQVGGAFPAGACQSTWGSVSMSAYGNYFAAYDDQSPYLHLFKATNGVYAALAAPATMPSSGNYWGADYNIMSPDGNYLVIRDQGQAGWGILYQRSGDTFTAITPPAQPAKPMGIGFSPNGRYMVAIDDGGGWGVANYAYVYIINGDGTFTLSTTLRFGELETHYGNPGTSHTVDQPKFSDDTKYLALPTGSYSGNVHVAVYNVGSGDAFTKVTTPLWAASGYPAGPMSFSSDDKYLAIGYGGNVWGCFDILKQSNSTTYIHYANICPNGYYVEALAFHH